LLRSPLLPEIVNIRDGQAPESMQLDEDLFNLALTPNTGMVPKLNKRSNALNSGSLRCQLPLRTHDTGSSSRSSGSLRSPDRFLPNTSPLDALSQRYHTNKEANKLSTTEKLLRRDIASIDAFSPRRRATSPTPLTPSPTPEQLSRSLHLGGEAERLVTISMLK